MGPEQAKWPKSLKAEMIIMMTMMMMMMMINCRSFVV
jgi:hypothetical protein